MYVIGILIGSYLIKKEVKRKGIKLTEDDVMNFIIWMVLGGVIGARIYYVLFNLNYYLANVKEMPAVWHGGLAIHGGLIGGGLAAWIYLKKKNVPFWRMADSVAPAIILGQALGRFGNFMNGDAHGRPTTMPWGIVFPPGSIAGEEFPNTPLHPTMFYEMFFNLSIFAFLWLVLRKKEHKDGYIFGMYIVLYSLGRFIVEHFRADSLMLGPLRMAQVMSLSIALAAFIIIYAKKMWEPSALRKGR